MKKNSIVVVIGIILVTLSCMIIGCGKKEGNGDKLQAAIDAVDKQKTPENYLTLSLRYYEAKQFEKSIEASREALKLKPDFAPAYNNSCAAYNELKMWDKGIEACQEALKIDPGFQLARNNLDWALRKKNMTE
jgi:protein O-mannosyl-transferase